jgi:hypothetical protein
MYAVSAIQGEIMLDIWSIAVPPYLFIGTVVILMHTLETAAAAVGRNKNAILRAIEAGKIPVAQAENGEIQIDPADLYRIYPLLRKNDTQQRVYQSPLLMPVAE